MNDVLLTSLNFVRTQTNISDNISDKYLMPAIREAQEMNYQQIIGTRLLQRLKSMVVDKSIDEEENEHYKAILGLSGYYLAYQTVANLVMLTTYKVGNIGANTTTDDNVQIPYMSEVFKLKDYYINKADFYCKNLQRYLVENYNKIPELSQAKVSEIRACLYSAASSGLWLGGARGKGHNGHKKCKCC